MHAYRYVKDILERLCIYFMSTGTSEDDKSLKMPPYLIPEGVIFHMFLGACSRPPTVGILCMLVCFIYYESVYLSYPPQQQ